VSTFSDDFQSSLSGRLCRFGNDAGSLIHLLARDIQVGDGSYPLGTDCQDQDAFGFECCYESGPCTEFRINLEHNNVRIDFSRIKANSLTRGNGADQCLSVVMIFGQSVAMVIERV
jgi:hypothetical protein